MRRARPWPAAVSAATGRSPLEATDRALKHAFPEPDPPPRLRSSRAERALAELLSKIPRSETPVLIDELVAIEKRGDSLLAFVPLFGPWLIRRSERLTAREKQRLSVFSVALTLATLAVVWTLMPSSADRLASLHERIESEMRGLGNVAERYRADHASYPDQATWARFAARADGRFFDPWGRPYRYEPRDDGLTLGTLGRDGREGGSDQDADVALDHKPSPAAAHPD
jgi:hypothetical protein